VTVAEALRDGAELLRTHGVPSPRTDAELLLAEVLGLGRTELYLQGARPLAPDDQAAYERLLARRSTREPLAYVLGEWGFRKLVLRVDARVLVPRPETEVVIERCLELVRGLPEPLVLDVGTGSGAIALALADEHPGARVTGIDTSAEALEVARLNAAATGLDGRIRLLEASFHDVLGREPYDLIVSNPPYVHTDEIETLEPEVRDWEPRAALVGDSVGEEIAEAARENPGGPAWLVLETAAGEAPALANRLDALGYRRVRVTQDLAGVERVVEGRWESTRS
jgi:release factor glutamine methyltransferase